MRRGGQSGSVCRLWKGRGGGQEGRGGVRGGHHYEVTTENGPSAERRETWVPGLIPPSRVVRLRASSFPSLALRFHTRIMGMVAQRPFRKLTTQMSQKRSYEPAPMRF